MVRIGAREVGSAHPCFVIAEAGVNHDGDVDQARRLVEAAAAAGADAVKFQTFRASRLATASAPKASYQLATTARGESQRAMLERLELSPEAHRVLVADCQRQGLAFLSSPFDEESADFLAELEVPAFKVPSGELVNLPFLRHLARHGRPLILSTGMAGIGEVEAAMHAVAGAEVVLLHCVSQYPAPAGEVNLRAMRTLELAFGCPVGYSDHTLGNEIAFAAVALGACVLEKHLTLDRRLPGPDHAASAEPEELRALVAGVRAVEAALGHGRKEPAACERDTAAAARKSLVAARDLAAGARLGDGDLVVRRPGTGLPPAALELVSGRRLRVDLIAGTVLSLEHLD